MAISLALNPSFSQVVETLKTVTTNGAATDQTIFVTGTARSGGLPIDKGIGMQYDRIVDCGDIFAYDFAASGYKNISLAAGGGNVGVGNQSPAYKFDVNGSAKAYTFAATSEIHTLGYQLRNGSGGLRWGLGGAGAESGSSSGYNFTIYRYNDAGNFVSESDFVVARNSGNVGIGTTSPAYKLDVNGNVFLGGGNIDPAIPNVLSPLANSGKLLIGWNRSGGGGEADFITNRGGGGTGGFRFFDYDNSGNLTSLMSISGTGDLFLNGHQIIGTNDDQRNLDVNGNIKTRRVKVTQTDWADYVFDSSYQLVPLNQVERFIQANKHLPEVPSAAEVKKDGLNLGDNQAVLLKKIEELTLYIIQQNKELTEQNKKLEEQDQRLKELEAKAK